MRNTIFQYWNGEITSNAKLSCESVRSYAKQLRCSYGFANNKPYFEKIGHKYNRYYDAFRPIFDTAFDPYDNVLYTDCDIFVDTDQNIFDEIGDHDIAICEENLPYTEVANRIGINERNDEIFREMVLREFGVIMYDKTYNSGVVLYSKKGLKRCRDEFSNIRSYIQMVEKYKLPSCYAYDQPFLNIMIQYASLSFKTLDQSWNSIVAGTKNQLIDTRTNDTKMTHLIAEISPDDL